jgi:hypothetical protein
MSSPTEETGQRVEVWSFRRVDIRTGQFVTSIGKATVGAIRGFGAEAIPGSMENVPQDWLDVNGIYKPPTFVMSPATRRRLERLKAQYASILDEEDHERLKGWSDRVDALTAIVEQLDQCLALGIDEPRR